MEYTDEPGEFNRTPEQQAHINRLKRKGFNRFDFGDKTNEYYKNYDAGESGDPTTRKQRIEWREDSSK